MKKEFSYSSSSSRSSRRRRIPTVREEDGENGIAPENLDVTMDSYTSKDSGESIIAEDEEEAKQEEEDDDDDVNDALLPPFVPVGPREPETLHSWTWFTRKCWALDLFINERLREVRKYYHHQLKLLI